MGTDLTFGFNSAVQTITDALDKIQDTARRQIFLPFGSFFFAFLIQFNFFFSLSHDRVIIVEVMGRDSGWLALHGGMAGRADVIIIPEIAYSVFFSLLLPPSLKLYLFELTNEKRCKVF